MTDDLVAFLRACLDEKAQRAVAMRDAVWPTEVWVVPSPDTGAPAEGEPTGCVAVATQYTQAFRRVWNPAQVGTDAADADTGSVVHDSAVQVWGPDAAATLLAEVDAKRQMIEMHGQAHECVSYDWVSNQINTCMWIDADETCTTLRLLAMPYSNRPGYRDDWRP